MGRDDGDELQRRAPRHERRLLDDALADYLIAPGSGSFNPFQVSAAPGGRYTMTLARSGADTPSQNTIPLYECSGCAPAPAQDLLPSTLSFLILRAYLPHDEISAVVLPDLTLHFADARDQTLPKCPGRSASPTRSVVTPPGWTFILRYRLAAGDPIGTQGPFPPPCSSPGAPACSTSMAAYYPETAECRSRTFEAGGTAACFPECQLARTALPKVKPRPWSSGTE